MRDDSRKKTRINVYRIQYLASTLAMSQQNHCIDIPHDSGETTEESPWIEMFYKKSSSGKRKLIFKSDDSRHYIESKGSK
jgi:hypothetical protein